MRSDMSVYVKVYIYSYIACDAIYTALPWRDTRIQYTRNRDTEGRKRNEEDKDKQKNK